MGFSDIEKWIGYELSGYPGGVTLPEYRVLKTTVIFLSSDGKQFLPKFNDEEFEKVLQTCEMAQSVHFAEGAYNETGQHYIPFDGPTSVMLKQLFPFEENGVFVIPNAIENCQNI